MGQVQYLVVDTPLGAASFICQQAAEGGLKGVIVVAIPKADDEGFQPMCPVLFGDIDPMELSHAGNILNTLGLEQGGLLIMEAAEDEEE